MKILVITDSYPPHHSGGYELRSRDIFESLRNKGHEITIITAHCPNKNCKLHENEENIERILHNKSETNSLISQIFIDILDMKNINKNVANFWPDIVYLSHLGNLPDPIIFYFFDRKIPIVFDDGGLGMVYVLKKFQQGLYY